MTDSIWTESTPDSVPSSEKFLPSPLWKRLLPRHLGANNSHHNFLAITSALTVFLLLTFAVATASPAAPGKPDTSVNSHSKNRLACNTDADCDSSKTYLRCYDKACQCSAITFFDEEINRCLIRVGASCTPKNQYQFCVAHADCVAPNKVQSTTGQCKCRGKFKETIDSLCISGTGSLPRQHHLLLLSPLVAFVGTTTILANHLKL